MQFVNQEGEYVYPIVNKHWKIFQRCSCVEEFSVLELSPVYTFKLRYLVAHASTRYSNHPASIILYMATSPECLPFPPVFHVYLY